MPNATAPVNATGLPDQTFDAELVRLGRELEMTETDRGALAAVADLACEDPVYERLWGVRGKIEALSATGLAGLFVKARAMEQALEYDPNAECDVLGSFVTLTQSLIRDLKAIEGRMAACPVEKIARDLAEIYQAEAMIEDAMLADESTENVLRRERQDEILVARHFALADVATSIQAKSLAGALFQICFLGGLAHTADPTPSLMDKIFRCACSAARAIEEAAGQSRNEIGGHHHLRVEFSPHLAADEALAEWRDKQRARSVGAENASQ